MQINPASIDWLLSLDTPGVSYLTLRDVLNRPNADLELQQAVEKAHREGAIAHILSRMEPEGYWEKAGPGYGPKYRSSVWALILLAQLGARVEYDSRLDTACHYMLEHALTEYGQFAYNRSPGGTFDCLQGNLCWALTALGCNDLRMDGAFEWMARTVTGEGIADKKEKNNPLRYYAYQCGSLFACGANNRQSCAWGAVKIMLAFSLLPQQKRTPLINSAIDAGVEFLLGVDPVVAAYPTGSDNPPNRSWWKFGFPVFYITDVLQIAEALVALGYVNDSRLKNCLEYIWNKQDEAGRWKLEYDYAGKTWLSYGKKGESNPWVTIRALRVVKWFERG
ncbi:MAG TPA: hypothetical protein PLI60_00240 [Anaerolineaceae bacterium]|nr:hypothetical protein [Anaerolineaceae bacterium]